MLVTVAIPTRNRPEHLGPLLDSLAAQNPVDFPWEVLVLDNSDPGAQETAMVCAEAASGFPVPLRRVATAEPGLHVGRNLAPRVAAGDILGYLDDDMLVDPGWLGGVRLLREGKAQAVMGRTLPLWEPGVDPDNLPEWASVVWDGKCSGYWSLMDFGDEPVPAAPDRITGGNCFLPRAMILELGGFNPDSLPSGLAAWRGDGETGFFRAFAARGYVAIYDPAALALHRIPPHKVTLEFVLDRAFKMGVSDSFSRIRAAGGIEKPWYTLINDAYLKGQLFHREQVRTCSELLEWVLRDTYLAEKP